MMMDQEIQANPTDRIDIVALFAERLGQVEAELVMTRGRVAVLQRELEKRDAEIVELRSQQVPTNGKVPAPA